MKLIEKIDRKISKLLQSYMPSLDNKDALRVAETIRYYTVWMSIFLLVIIIIRGMVR